MLIMFELLNDPKTTLKPLAEKLGMTIQGVSEYLKLMQKEGLIYRQPDKYKPTKIGVQFLHDNIAELRDFVVDAIKRIEFIQMCVAVARTKINEGDKVGLFMEKGILTAYVNRQSCSTGIALMNSEPGDDVQIKDLEGIVELSQGRLVVIELPSIADGGTRAMIAQRVRKVLSQLRYDKLGVLDTVGLVLSNKLKLKHDFEFAAASSGIDAVQKGLDVVLIGSSDETSRFITLIEELNAKSTEKIRYKLIRMK